VYSTIRLVFKIQELSLGSHPGESLKISELDISLEYVLNKLRRLNHIIPLKLIFKNNIWNINKVSGSQSINTGFAPTSSTTLAVAIKVIAGTITSTPGPIARARSVATALLL
jgi:hypothetical protein